MKYYTGIGSRETPIPIHICNVMSRVAHLASGRLILRSGGATGGTGQALRLASKHGIEIINLYNYDSSIARLKQLLVTSL